MTNIISKEKCIVIDGASLPLNSMVCNDIANGALLTMIGSTSSIRLMVSDTTIDSVPVVSKDELIAFLQENCFSINGGGSGASGAVNSINSKTPDEFGAIELTASDVGAGTSNLEIGTTSTTAMAGDKTFATTAQGSLADSAVQPSTLSTSLSIKSDLVAGKVPESQLPSYIDNVQEYADLATFPATGESNVVYLAIDTNKPYRWGGSSYVEITSGMALGETSSTAYRGDRGKIAYDYAIAHNNVDNTSDINKPVSTTQATAIGLKQNTLVSGTNIKTVDGVSILGGGNLVSDPVTSTSTANSVKTNEYANRFEYTCKIPFNSTISVSPANYTTITTTFILPVGVTFANADEHYISIRNDNRAVTISVWDNTSRVIIIGLHNTWPNASNIAIGSVFIKIVKYK